MTIRVNMDLWPLGDRAQAKRIGAITIDDSGPHTYKVTIQDSSGMREEVTITGWQWESRHPWQLIAEALRMVEEKEGQ